MRERSPRREAESPNASAPTSTDSQAQFPYPFNQRAHYNYFVNSAEQIGTIDETQTFFAAEAEARFIVDQEYFQVKKAVPKDAEIRVDKLPYKAQKLFLGPGGSREKEWKNMVGATTPDGGPAVRIYRGKQAREMCERGTNIASSPLDGTRSGRTWETVSTMDSSSRKWLST